MDKGERFAVRKKLGEVRRSFQKVLFAGHIATCPGPNDAGSAYDRECRVIGEGYR